MSTTQLFARVKKLGLELPDVEAGVAWGGPALKVADKMIAAMATNRAAEPGSLVVCVDFDQRDELIAADPQTYYIKDHYVSYPSVLVRLARIRDDALRDLLLMAADFRKREARRPKRSTPARRTAKR